MKRFILLPLLPLFLTGILHAQSFNLGIKAGPQLSTFTSTSDAESVWLYHAGVFSTMNISERFQAQAEVLLSTSGVDDKETDYYKQRHLYLNVPLTVKFKVFNRLSVHAGAQFGYLMDAKLKITEGDDKGKYDRKDLFNKTEIAWIAGAEYMIGNRLSVGIRVNRAFTKLAKDYDDPRQNVEQIFLAYRLFGASY
ncbi:MAG: PorT family protein [Lewinellaceae bacterium]|nr:PorT family protein [Saprospiraceae bacterium]MCB9305858.1 PorT family protein [Lewinellaceae bacterium]